PDRPLHPAALHPHLLSASLSRLCHFAELLLASRALSRLSMGPAARENRGPLPLSIVGWFSPLPWRESVAGSVAPDGCHLVLAAARASPAASGEDAQSGNRLATIPG